MSSEPYREARRVFWVVDNGPSHRGRPSIERLEGAHRNLRLIHLPIHASWLNQVEIYFSILERTVLTPPDAASLDELAARILAWHSANQHTGLLRETAGVLARLGSGDATPIHSGRGRAYSADGPGRHENPRGSHQRGVPIRSPRPPRRANGETDLDAREPER